MSSTPRASSTPPDNANAECVGPESEKAGKSSSCDGCPNQKACSSGAFNSPEAQAKSMEETMKLKSSLENVEHVVLVLSGKGGVGKSTVSCQLAHTLAYEGYCVGLLDVDLCGPSAPRMILGDSYSKSQIKQTASGGWIPVYNEDRPNLCCVSISFLLPDENRDQAVVWRGPRKNGMIQQFLTQVDWTGSTDGLDYLIVDTPPGTSDEHISTVQYLQKAGKVSGAILVTTPEEVSMADVRKELNFCVKTSVPVLGVVENMGRYTTTLDKLTFTCKSKKTTDAEEEEEIDCTQKVLDTLRTHCPELFNNTDDNGGGSNGNSNDNNATSSSSSLLSVSSMLYPPSNGGPKLMAQQYNVPYWGTLPMDPDLLQACENGKCFVEVSRPNSLAASKLKQFANRILKELIVDELLDDDDQ